jgi:hypothetical protein
MSITCAYLPQDALVGLGMARRLVMHRQQAAVEQPDRHALDRTLAGQGRAPPLSQPRSRSPSACSQECSHVPPRQP